MKNRYYVAIFVILAISLLFLIISSIDNIECKIIPTYGNCAHFEFQNDEPYKPSLEQLQMVLNYCNDTSEFKNAVGIEYFNDTHYTNNNLCKWQKLTQFPNSDEFCIPDQNMRANEEIRNDTHIYNKDKCLWEEEFSWEKEWNDKFQDPKDAN